MAVTIRLKREGSHRNPHFRVVVIDKRRDTQANFLEQVGHYHPKSKEDSLKIELDRVEHWIGLGAQPSETVTSLIKKAKKVSAKK